MSFEIRDTSWYFGLVVVQWKTGNVMALAWKEDCDHNDPEREWHFMWRTRKFTDDAVFDSHDEKQWFAYTRDGSATEAEIEADLRRMVALTEEFWGAAAIEAQEVHMIRGSSKDVLGVMQRSPLFSYKFEATEAIEAAGPEVTGPREPA